LLRAGSSRRCGTAVPRCGLGRDGFIDSIPSALHAVDSVRQSRSHSPVRLALRERARMLPTAGTALACRPAAPRSSHGRVGRG
jgi:hypothetical protein